MQESSLHKALKQVYSQGEGVIEAQIDGFQIDVLKNGELIEIQTRHFHTIKHKLNILIRSHPIRLVYPIAEQRWIIRVNSDGKVTSKRKSPKKGKLVNLFDELIRLPTLINHPNFRIEVVLIHEEEVRRDDGLGSWRRKGVSIVDRRLIRIIDHHNFENPDDFLQFLPNGLQDEFTSKQFSNYLRVSIHLARKILYCLKSMDIVRVTGKQGNAFIYSRAL